MTDRSLISKIGAHESWARTEDRSARTLPGRIAAMDRFEKMVPAEITDPLERAKRAEHLKKAHFLRMARKSAEKRRMR